MTKLKRDPGLIRYDSLNGLEGGEKRFLRPRLALYAVLGVVGLVVASLAIQSRTAFESNMLRQTGVPFIVTDGGDVRNSYEIHLVNKREESAVFHLEPATDGMDFVIPRTRVELPSLDSATIPVFATLPREQMESGLEARVEVSMEGAPEETRVVGVPFLGPSN
jgi:hypothetical protein